MKYIKKFEDINDTEIFSLIKDEKEWNNDWNKRDPIYHNNIVNRVKELIESGVDINQLDDEDDTPLISAIYFNQEEIVKMLIEAGADLDIQDSFGRTALFWACNKNMALLVQTLIKKCVNLDFVDNNGDTALTVSSICHYMEIVKLLIEAGADWNIKNENGKYFLDWLTFKQRKKIIDLYPEQYEKYLKNN